MDTTASLLSPLPSPRTSSCSSSSCYSPSSSSSFSFSPLPSPRPISSSRPDLDSFSSSSIWGSPKPFTIPLQPPPPTSRPRPPALDISNYASSTAEPSQKQWSCSPSPHRTHYTLLGVSPNSSPREIRAAYHKLALQHHPDVNPLHQLDTSTKLFAEINEAYATLADPQKKACYDLKLALESPVRMASMVGVPFQAYSSPSPRKYTDMTTGRVYPSMNSFYREWRRTQT